MEFFVRRDEIKLLKRVKKMLMVFGMAILAPSIAFADTWTDPETEIRWRYYVKDGEAIVGDQGNIFPAVSTTTSGEITIPSTLGECPVTAIGKCAFENCNSLTSITMPSSVMNIGERVFYGCSGMMSVTIPSGVTNIGERAFYDCGGLMAINVESGNNYYSSKDGVLFNKDKTELMAFPGGKSGSYVVPSGVMTICKEAFYGNVKLTGITLPNSVIHVETDAFRGTGYWNNKDNGFVICGKVLLGYKYDKSNRPTSLTIPEGVEMIADSAFDYYNNGDNNGNLYWSLTAVTFPSTLKRVGKSAFYGQSKIAKVVFKSGLIEIDDSAFFYCSGLSTLSIPDTIKRIGRRAFYLTDDYNQEVMSYIYIHANGLVICEEAFAYHGKTSDKGEAKISLTGSGIEVGDRAFAGYQHGLKVVLDLTGVSKIGDYAFANAGYYAAKRYSYNGFYACGHVELSISDQLQHASQSAFSWASIGRVNVPNWNAVYGCAGWLSFLSGRSSANSAYEGFYCLLIVNGEAVDTVEIPDGTVSVPEKAFKGLRIDHFVIPSSVETIGDLAFAYTRATLQFKGEPPSCDGTPFVRCCSGGYPIDDLEWTSAIDSGLWNGLPVTPGDVLDYTAALDAPGLTFTNTGWHADWFVQSTDKHDGDSAMRGNSGIYGGTRLECEIVGPAELSYWWKLNKEYCGSYGYNSLSLYIDDAWVTNINSDATWELVVLEVGSGKHRVKWQYNESRSYYNYCDGAGFIDAVSVTYDVHFDLDNGSVVSGDLDQKVKHGTAATAPVVLAPAGYVFDGWDKELQPISGPVTYVAKYRRPSIADALNNSDSTQLQFVNDKDSPWSISDVAHDDVVSVRSGRIGDNDMCDLTATFKGAGTFSFFWKASTEIYKSTPIDYGVLLVDGVEKARIGGDKDWCQVAIEIAETTTHTVVWRYKKDEEGSVGDDCIWVDEVKWTPVDPIPELSADASKLEIEAALNGSADARLANHIKDGTTYGQYREWAESVKGTSGEAAAGAQAVKDSPNAWVSFALGSDKLLAETPKDEDLTVEAFEPTGEAGKFEFTVSVNDVEVGSGAQSESEKERVKENLKQVLGLDGATTLEADSFSAGNVDLTFDTPVDGKVKFTAGPKDTTQPTFFMKVRVK